MAAWKSPQWEQVSDEYSIIVTGAAALPSVFSASIADSDGSGVVGVGAGTVVEEGVAGEDDESPPHDAHASAASSSGHTAARRPRLMPSSAVSSLPAACCRPPPTAYCCYAIRLQMAATFTMSSTLQPRERSQYGFLSPCTIGPTASAPPIRSVSL